MNPRALEILLVEDNDADIQIIQEAFDELHNGKKAPRIVVTRDGDEAMAYLRSFGKYGSARQPDIVLLDINMPKKNGFEVLEEIKSESALKHIPVVMLTTSNRKEDILKAYQEGAVSYILKPLKFEALRAVLKYFLDYWACICQIPSDVERK